MRGRILWMTIAILGTAAALAACGRKDSLYIEPGKEAAPGPEPAKAAPPKPAETPPPKS
jgi:predicted small lipoprotein YifL